MRIVLDTNVVLSALLRRGTPHRLLSTIRQHEHVELFSSPALLTELGDVLTRSMPTARLALLGRAAHEVLREYADAAELVIPAAVPPVVAADADDDQVIAAAVAAEADLLVSGDRHLLALGRHNVLDIVTAADALERISLA